MNTKKILVGLLLILTIIIGIVAIYFATTLKTKNTDNTNTPTPTIKITKTITPTEELILTATPVLSGTVAPTPAPLSCGASCNTGSCSTGFECLSINGSKKCVSRSCVKLSGADYVDNNNCESDLCSVKDAVKITKTATISCISGQTNRRIVFNIKLVNPVGVLTARTNISLVDVLNPNLKDSYIDTKTISSGGTLKNGQIEWSALKLDANGGSVELHYEAIVPSTENGKSYSNTVSILESGVQKNQLNFEYSVNILPCTALITDEVDRVLIGVMFLIFGVFIYKMNWTEKIGLFYSKNGGNKINQAFKNIYLDMTQNDMEKYERKTIRESKRN